MEFDLAARPVVPTAGMGRRPRLRNAIAVATLVHPQRHSATASLPEATSLLLKNPESTLPDLAVFGVLAERQ